VKCTFCDQEISEIEADAITALSQTSLWPARMDALATKLLDDVDDVVFCTDCILEDADDEERQAIIDALAASYLKTLDMDTMIVVVRRQIIEIFRVDELEAGHAIIQYIRNKAFEEGK